MTTSIPAEAVLVFDVDDTLYLERDYVRSGFDAVGDVLANELGLAGLADTLWAGFEDGVRGDAFDRALAAHGIEPTQERISAMVDCYRGHRPRIELLPDARRLLQRARPRRFAAITDGPAPSQRAKVESLGLLELASPIVLTAELGPGRSKPSPVAYREVEQALGVEPERFWYVGDNPAKDFVAPLARGWTSVRVRRTGSLHEAIATPDGVFEIHSLDELAC